jgi:hypothetical protein
MGTSYICIYWFVIPYTCYQAAGTPSSVTTLRRDNPDAVFFEEAPAHKAIIPGLP